MAIYRKPRKNKSIEFTSKLFSKFVREEDYEKAAKITFWCVLKEFAREGIMNALNDANSFIKRKKMRRGL
jgi:hypothetical protein